MKPNAFPGSSVSFSLCGSANQEEPENRENEVEFKQKKDILIQTRFFQITGKSCR